MMSAIMVSSKRDVALRYVSSDDEIVKEAKKLDKLDLQALLTKLRVKKMLKAGINRIAGYDKRKIKSATLTQIDGWKHHSRKSHPN